MTIPFRVKKLTATAKLPERANEGDLWDLFADDFCVENIKDLNEKFGEITDINYPKKNIKSINLHPRGRILVKTGIAIELPKALCPVTNGTTWVYDRWGFDDIETPKEVYAYAVADIRPRSGLALKHGITVLNTPGTIDNSYRKEIGVIIYNADDEPYTINKGDKIAQMLIRPLYPSSMEVVEEIEDTSRGAYGSTNELLV